MQHAEPHSADAAERQQLTERLQHANEELEDFVYSVSHDLRSPVGSIIQLAQLLEMDYGDKLDAHGMELVTTISDCGKRMLDLLQSLLDYSRALSASGGETPPVPAAEPLEAALANLQAQIKASEAKITFDKMPDVRIPGMLLVQLFQNIIGNAVHYRGAQPLHVHVSAIQEQDMWRFAVSDNGKGIEPRFHALVFQPFKRADSSNKQGAGLGLALCRKIVERAGGRIWVDSEPGKGSTFYFTLPAA